MNKNLKKLLLFINLMFLNWILMVTIHELIHYSVTTELEEICFLGYNKEINTAGWLRGIEKEEGLYNKQNKNSFWLYLTIAQFIIITIIIGITVKHKYK